MWSYLTKIVILNWNDDSFYEPHMTPTDFDVNEKSTQGYQMDASNICCGI